MPAIRALVLVHSCMSKPISNAMAGTLNALCNRPEKLALSASGGAMTFGASKPPPGYSPCESILSCYRVDKMLWSWLRTAGVLAFLLVRVVVKNSSP